MYTFDDLSDAELLDLYTLEVQGVYRQETQTRGYANKTYLREIRDEILRRMQTN